MVLNLKGLVLALAVGGISSAKAAETPYIYDGLNGDFLKIKGRHVREIVDSPYQKIDFDRAYLEEGLPVSEVNPTEQIGKVIAVARDLVALGEDVYKLVIKGKPSNKTDYAPISVIPRVNGQPVDMLDTERWTAPVKRTYEVAYENTYGIDVVVFRFSVMYSYNGSYDGKGAYLTSVQVIPEFVRTLFGFDFTATMKMGGIQNQGTKQDPVAGVTILVEHTVSSVMVARNQVDTFFITGKGFFKRY